MSISLLRADKEIAEIFERQYRTVYRVCFSYMKSAADTESSSNVEITPMISSFGESTYSGDIAVVNGGIAFSDALEAALQEYGNTVRYRVVLEFFKDGVQIDSAGEIAMKEFDGLAEAGYIVALETYNEGYIEQHLFTLHATAEQLRSFPGGKGTGVFFPAV